MSKEKSSKTKIPSEKSSNWVSETRAYRESMREHHLGDFANLESDPDYHSLFLESDLTLHDEELRQAKLYGKEEVVLEEEPPKLKKTEPEPVSNDELEAPKPETKAKPKKEEPKDSKNKPFSIKEASNKTREKLRQEFGVEYLIGETLIPAIGAVILMFSLGLLINEGVKAGVVTEFHRILIGVAVSGGLLAFAHQQYIKRPSLSNLAAWGGFIGFYVLNVISHLVYEFYDTDAFLFINILVTAGILITSLQFKNVALFYLAILGVYYSPVVVAMHIDYLHVMLYLIFSSILIMVIAYRQNWNYINIVLFACVVLPMIHWLFTKTPATEEFSLTFMIVTGVCGLFYGMVLFFGIQKDRKLTNAEYAMYFLSIAIYFGIVLKMIYFDAKMPLEDFGFFMFAFGLFCAGITGLMYFRRPFDTILFDGTQVIALLLITFSIPIFTEPSTWNFLWIIESVILLWLAQSTDLRFVRNASGSTVVLAIIMLVHDWIVTYTGTSQVFFFNAAVKSAIYTVLVLGISVYLMIRNEDKYGKNDTILFLTYEVYRNLLAGFTVFVIWGIGNIELNYHNLTDKDHAIILNGIYNSLFFAALWFVSKHYQLNTKKVMEGILYFFIISYVLVDRLFIVDLRNAYLMDGGDTWGYMTHYLYLIILVAISTLLLIDNQKNTPKYFEKIISVFASLGVIYLTFEFEHIYVTLNHIEGLGISDLLNDVWHIGWEILWALCAVTLIWLGIRYQLKPLRMLALVLFAGILIKFFVRDFRLLTTLQQLTSTMILGLLLLGIGKQYGKKFLRMINDGTVPENFLEDSNKDEQKNTSS